MRVLIAPVGEQPIPNLIPLFTTKAQKPFTLVQFMVPDDSRIREVATNLRKTIALDTTLVDVKVADKDLTMNAWDLAKACEECKAAITSYFEEGNEVIVNLTGGTKIMALAAYQAAVNTGTPMIYVNTEQTQIIQFNEQGKPTSTQSFKAPINILTQLHAAGRELKRNPRKPLLRANDIKKNHAEFAKYLVDRYIVVYSNLIRSILDLASQGGGQAWGRPVPFIPQGQSVDAAKRAHDTGLWIWDQTAGTITITSKEAFEFLKGGWVEIFVLKTLADDGRFDDVLGNVEIKGFDGEGFEGEDFKGELDVVVTRNGRLGIIECKTSGPQKGQGLTYAVAKVRLHEVIFGGPYATAVFALPSPEISNEWREIFDQYKLPEPIHGTKLKELANIMSSLLGP